MNEPVVRENEKAPKTVFSNERAGKIGFFQKILIPNCGKKHAFFFKSRYNFMCIAHNRGNVYVQRYKIVIFLKIPKQKGFLKWEGQFDKWEG